ncbi:MAG: arsenite S-adenosylmethyltransferase, partial [Candidatus Bathyarchaeia archaeon]
MKENAIKEVVKKRYSRIVEEGGSCCPVCGPCGLDVIEQARAIGYSEKELKSIPAWAIMGLG